jgi:hypothetical protein
MWCMSVLMMRDGFISQWTYICRTTAVQQLAGCADLFHAALMTYFEVSVSYRVQQDIQQQ